MYRSTPVPIAALAIVASLLVPLGTTRAARPTAACAPLGSYTVLRYGAYYAASAPPSGGNPLVSGGTASISSYTGCGATTALTIDTTGPGTLLKGPLTPIQAITLRGAGDLLLRFTGKARQDPQAPADPHAVLLSGTATYARVTTKGSLRGRRSLDYSTSQVSFSAVKARLRVSIDLGGSFSLICALPGPTIGKVASSFSYVAVGVRNPKAVTATTPPSKNL